MNAVETKPASSDTITQITDVLMPHRLIVDQVQEVPGHDVAIQTIRERAGVFVDQNKPIQMILPAFPCKSVSRRKVFGELPDKAEELSLRFLDGICKSSVRQIHSAGAELTICSDGRVFSPIVRVSDEAVSRYSSKLEQTVDKHGFSSISLFHLENAFSGDKESIRDQLFQDFATPIDELKAQAKQDLSLMSTFRGITRFMFEETLAWDEQQGMKRSRNQVQKDAKQRAWQVVQASQAWSALTDTEIFSNALRLSIHPQADSSHKFGVTLLPTRDSFLTPWHGVAVVNEEIGNRLVRKSDLATNRPNRGGFLTFLSL
ncbi:hypothetical protein BH23PAT2_BH23PAT2_10260 [soil metagenome]